MRRGLSVLFGAALFAAQPARPLKRYRAAEAYEIYSTILPQAFRWNDALGKPPVILNETNAYEICLRPNGESKRVIGPAMDDFVQQNKTHWLLERKFSVKEPYQLISEGKLFPHSPEARAWFELGAVGFNSDRTIAVAYIGYHCGSPCGQGQFFVLHKIHGKWLPAYWTGLDCSWVS